MRLAGIPATRQRQPDRLLPIISAWHHRRGDAQSCVQTHSTVDSLSGSRVGTRDIVWLLATLSVQLYFPCTPSSQGVEGSLAAANLMGLSLSPFPLFLPQVLFSLCPVLGLPWKPAAGPDAGSRLRLMVNMTNVVLLFTTKIC